MKRSFKLTIDGKTWTVKRVSGREIPGAWGTCDKDTRTIRISEKAHGRQLLYVAFEEIIHARLWDIDHEAVHETADLLANAALILIASE